MSPRREHLARRALLLLVSCGFLTYSVSSRSLAFPWSSSSLHSHGRSLLEDESFTVSISSDLQGSITNSPAPLFVVNFSRAILQKNPLALFMIAGSNRVDVVYSKDQGLLYIVAFVENNTQPGKVKLDVPAGVATTSDGSHNAAATYTINYQPGATGSSASAFASFANWGLTGSMALSVGAAALSPMGTIGVGAINFAGFAQTFSMTGNLPITNMPQNYREATSNMQWVALQPAVGPLSPAPTQEQKDLQQQILSNATAPFPYPPVEVSVLTVNPDGSPSNNQDPSNAYNDGADGSAESSSGSASAVNNTAASGKRPGIHTITVKPLPPEDLVTPNGTVPNPFVGNTSSSSNSGTDGSTSSQQQGAGQQQELAGQRQQGQPAAAPAPSSTAPNGTPSQDAGSSTTSAASPGGPLINPAGTASSSVPGGYKGSDSSGTASNGSSNGAKSIAPTTGPFLPGNSITSSGSSGPTLYSGKDGMAVASPPAATAPKYLPPGYNMGQSDGQGIQVTIPAAAPSSAPGSSDVSVFVPAIAPSGSSSPPGSNKEAQAPLASTGPTSSLSPPIPSPPPPPPLSPPPLSPLSPPPLSPPPLSPPPPSPSPKLVAAVKRRKARSLLLEDPISALASSGFSYVVTSATPQGIAETGVSPQPGQPWQPSTQPGNGTEQSEEQVGASALSRIRTIQALAATPDADHRRLDSLWSVLFWSAVAIAAVLMVHLVVLGLLRWGKKAIPKMLHLPRLELLVFMMTLPMIAAAGAALLRSSSPGIVVLGTFFAIVLPFGFLFAASTFLVLYLLRKQVEQRRAVYIVLATSDVASSLGRVSGSSSTAESDVSSRTDSLTQVMLSHHSNPYSDAFMIGTTESLSQQHDGITTAGLGSSSTASPVLFSYASQENNNAPNSNSNENQQTHASPETRPRHWIPSVIGSTWKGAYRYLLRPIFGFPDRDIVGASTVATEDSAWLGRGKWDATFVKRYGCFFEDTHGPQVLRVRSQYEYYSMLSAHDAGSEGNAAAASGGGSPREEVVGSGVLVPATPDGAEGALQALQTFGIVFAVTKMVLFAVVINGPGGVNSIAQVIALVMIAALHVIYLRLCTPYRLHVELAAEIVASTCDLAVFVCGIVLIAKPHWTEQERHSMGIAMLTLQAVGFLVFISIRVLLALRTFGLTLGPTLKEMLPSWMNRRGQTSGNDHAPTGAVVARS